jgi:hypothetical protein
LVDRILRGDTINDITTQLKINKATLPSTLSPTAQNKINYTAFKSNISPLPFLQPKGSMVNVRKSRVVKQGGKTMNVKYEFPRQMAQYGFNCKLFKSNFRLIASFLLTILSLF